MLPALLSKTQNARNSSTQKFQTQKGVKPLSAKVNSKCHLCVKLLSGLVAKIATK